VDERDHIWVLNRPRDLNLTNNYLTLSPPAADCCVAAPAVIEFDIDGNVLRAWGTPDMVSGWPRSEHTIVLDRQHNVYIGGAAAGDTLMKFTEDGKFVSDFGHRGPVVEEKTQRQDNQQTDLLVRGVAAVALDDRAREIYVADGYLNRRVLVFDWDTGAVKRGWGAYGKPLSEIANEIDPEHDPRVRANDFKSPVHCVRIARDGLVYVCDRAGDRVQVFTKEGKFVKEFYVANETLMRGTAGSVEFSSDREQRYIFVADIMNMAIWQLDRQSGAIVSRIGRAGPAAGEFTLVHVAAIDSHGNLYTGEVGPAPRLQKFSPHH
jgi:hypothetical protein